MMDGESQMSSTRFFLSNMPEYMDGPFLYDDVVTLGDVLSGYADIEDAIIHLHYEAKRKILNRFKDISCDLDIIPSCKRLDEIELEDDGTDPIFIVKQKLNLLRAKYDFIIMDFPPAYSEATQLFSVACDYILCPAILEEDDCLVGCIDVMDNIKFLRDNKYNTQIKMLGMFYTMGQLYKKRVQRYFDGVLEDKDYLRLFDTVIREDGAANFTMKETHQPLCICAYKSKAAKDYEALTDEILDRLGLPKAK